MTSLEAQSAYISSSTLSALSASTSLLEEVDLDLIEEIIERAPRSATSFPYIYRSYCQVLEEHGLSATTDERIYHFLLKLGVIRAPTWGEKWDLFKTTQAPSLSPRRKANVTHVSPRRRARATSIVSTLGARVDRNKITFLASASSDLDEGFAASTDDGQIDIESILGLGRPSPRKVLRDRSRSMVGYTPDISGDEYDLMTLNPPIRTSTPINAHNDRRTPRKRVQGPQEGSPDLPPYSVSDISQSLDITQGSAPSTPRPRNAHLSRDPYEDTWSSDRILDAEERADEFYQLGLLGRCLDVWTQSHDWVKSTTEQIDRVRRTLLLRQSVTKWKDAYEYQLSLPGTADHHRRMHLQAQSMRRWQEKLKVVTLQRKEEEWRANKEEERIREIWRKWRTVVVKRRTEKWQKDVARKQKLFMRAKDGRIIGGVFEEWYWKTREALDAREADRLFAENIQRRILGFWIKKATTTAKLRTVLLAQEENMKHTVLETWKREARLAEAERMNTRHADQREKLIVLGTWRVKARHDRDARKFGEKRVLSAVFARWKAERVHYNYMQRKAQAFHDASVLRDSMRIWVTQERGVLFERVKDVRTLHQALDRWKNRKQDIQRLQTQAESLTDSFRQNSLHRSFSRWRARLGDQNQKSLRALLFLEASEQDATRKALIKWREQLNVNRSKEATAVKARAFFVGRQALRVWKMRLRQREQERWADEKRLHDTAKWFNVWKDRLAQNRSDDQAVQRFQQKSDSQTVSRVLDKWTGRVVAIKTREHVIYKERNFKLKRDALHKWLAASTRIKNAKNLMYSHIQVRTEDHLKRVLLDWRDKAVRARHLRIQADQSIIDREDQLVVQAFGKWRERVAERRLRDVEAEVALRREDGLMFAVWDTWKVKSTRLPEISFKKKRIVKNAWTKWRTALEMRRAERSISGPRDDQLLVDVFAVWKEATKRKMANGAIRRRGRTRPTTETTRRVSGPESSRRVSFGVEQASMRFSPHPPTPGPSDRRVPMRLPANTRTKRQGETASTNSEPAYSRLRSELYRRQRGGSEEPEDPKAGTSELVRQLRGALSARPQDWKMPSGSDARSKAANEAKKKRDARMKYLEKTKTETVGEVVGVADLEREFMKGGEWEPAWGHVEFDFDACLKNITKEGKAKDGFFVPAGSILPLGAALPEMTVLKYGGYFPAGTTFQGGIMIPIHARMVNVLPQASFDPTTMLEESLCLVQ